MSEKRYTDRKLLRNVFGSEASYKQGRKDVQKKC